MPFILDIIQFFPCTFQDNLKLIANQIKLLEKDLDKHHEEVGEIKKQINTIQIQNNKDDSQINQYNQLDTNEMVKESVINADMTYRGDDTNQCNSRMDTVPTPDIQVCVHFTTTRRCMY